MKQVALFIFLLIIGYFIHISLQPPETMNTGATITELNTTISNLTEENANKDETISNLNTQIETLNSQIGNLEQQIENLQSQLEQSGSSGSSGETEVITDLSGTSWVFKEYSVASDSSFDSSFNLKFNFDNQEFETTLNFEKQYVNVQQVSFMKSDYSGTYYFYQSIDSGKIGWYFEDFNGNGDLIKVNSTVLTIVGGEDATNTLLIEWLQENAVLQN